MYFWGIIAGWCLAMANQHVISRPMTWWQEAGWVLVSAVFLFTVEKIANAIRSVHTGR